MRTPPAAIAGPQQLQLLQQRQIVHVDNHYLTSSLAHVQRKLGSTFLTALASLDQPAQRASPTLLLELPRAYCPQAAATSLTALATVQRV